ncbi:MAG TPA: cytochrome P450 [Caulobacteraceae bacterium]|nr:cytochrome P450 [Caulobacteraceae bacterium]
MTAMALDARRSPPLVGARPSTPPRTWRERRRARRERLFPTVPERAFHEPVVQSRSILGNWILVNDPAGIKRVLVDKVASYPRTELERRFFTALFGEGLLGIDGELWRRHRRVMAPSFDPRSVAAYAPAITASAAEAIERWRGLGEGARIDMTEEMTWLTLQIICRTMFSADAESMVGHFGRGLHDNLDDIGEFSLLDIVPGLAQVRMRARRQRIAAAFAPLDEAIARLVAEREKAPDAFPADLLGRLVAAKDAEGGGRLTPKEVRDEVVTIFSAGHETTAMTMGWTWYLLSRHPAEEARLHNELAEVLGGRLPSQEDLPRLIYARRVIEEAMRLYPAAPGLSARTALEDDEIAGASVRKGATVGILPWYVHRHALLWDDPERFDPDRFSPERSAGRHRFAYLPFGGGPRVCIGQVLAMNEAVLLLAALAQRFAPRLAADARIALRHNVTLQPRYGMPMTLHGRG